MTPLAAFQFQLARIAVMGYPRCVAYQVSPRPVSSTLSDDACGNKREPDAARKQVYRSNRKAHAKSYRAMLADWEVQKQLAFGFGRSTHRRES